MTIKTYRQDFEIWKLNDEKTADVLRRLREDLGDAWQSEAPEVINDLLRNYLYQNGQPCEEITGEGFLPTAIEGENGFFEQPEQPIESRDLFDEIVENPDAVPPTVHAILNTWEENADPYHECARICKDLATFGYTFDWGLSGEPYNLRRIRRLNLVK